MIAPCGRRNWEIIFSPSGAPRGALCGSSPSLFGTFSIGGGGTPIVYWDIGPVRPDPDNPGQTIGVPPPPIENLPNREGEDPHSAPRGAPDGLKMISQFLRPQGAITDVCGGRPCYAGGWTGP